MSDKRELEPVRPMARHTRMLNYAHAAGVSQLIDYRPTGPQSRRASKKLNHAIRAAGKPVTAQTRQAASRPPIRMEEIISLKNARPAPMAPSSITWDSKVWEPLQKAKAGTHRLAALRPASWSRNRQRRGRR